MSGLFIFLVIFLAVICAVLVVSKFNQHPFIVLTVITIAVGLACGTPTEEIINTVRSGFGNVLVDIGIVILARTIIGTILEKTGATLTMTNTTLKMVGEKNSVLAMAIADYMAGIPVFCDSDFVTLSPISRALASQNNVSLAVMATALSDSLYATHCLVSPTPGPITMAGTLEANLGLTILAGLLVSIPAILSALIYAKKVSSKVDIPTNPGYTVGELLRKYGGLPGALHSFSLVLLPIVLIALKSISDFPSAPFGDGVVKTFFSFVGNPVIVLILGVSLAMTLVLAVEKKNILSWIIEGITNSAGILAITGTGSTFGVILQKLPIADALSAPLLGLDIGVFLPFIIAILLKTAMGAFTMAMIATSAMTAPLMPALGFTSPLAKALVIMAVGAGSMTVSHANDPCFQVVSQFSDMKTKDAYKCQTGIAGVMGIVTIIVVSLLSLVFVH